MMKLISTYKNHYQMLLIALAVVTALSSCTKEQVKPQLQDGSSTVVTDLPGDVGSTINTGFKTFYFSFSTNSKVDSTARQSTLWDLSFGREYNSYIGINNGTNAGSYGFGGAGKGALIVVNQAYDLVKEAPSDADFTGKGVTSVGWDPGNGLGWYFYDLKTHIAVPIKGRTFVLRTAEGKYAKLELVSMYKGAPAVVTDLNWPSPYFTFRYYVQQDGSRNLSTKN
ncbi:HmuY family protein [Mucilaginibacter sp. SJ]|uniref:HmuY family protein n=1 Tax=Mucilaginibacter sp. SJ TaxID=3029053 RepID=UPI0023A9461B|nr:HmuY family protein [Mucilaginibacter sp. SJ]WEA01514.1 HmuY family protein [Mucilaginibacter sp. SJ]